MKLREDINPDILLELGFNKIDKEEAAESENTTLAYYDYEYLLGFGRRGQSYSLLYSIDKNNFSIYATEPDGSGSPTTVDDIFIKLTSYVIA